MNRPTIFEHECTPTTAEPALKYSRMLSIAENGENKCLVWRNRTKKMKSHFGQTLCNHCENDDFVDCEGKRPIKEHQSVHSHHVLKFRLHARRGIRICIAVIENGSDRTPEGQSIPFTVDCFQSTKV
jgi:hypothetical protein